ncbi:hypothetical protein AC1031_013503 [Aphanomyces cochlioides]|nr:hypothetical protein AC1031_013503 [Aphanomyces cochlioides]
MSTVVVMIVFVDIASTTTSSRQPLSLLWPHASSYPAPAMACSDHLTTLWTVAKCKPIAHGDTKRSCRCHVSMDLSFLIDLSRSNNEDGADEGKRDGLHGKLHNEVDEEHCNFQRRVRGNVWSPFITCERFRRRQCEI